MSFPLPVNESQRLKSLELLEILDTEAEQEFDDLTRLAAQICEVPISLVSLIDADRQWFKSEIGLGMRETPRDISFCAHAIVENDVFVIPNATEDARFADNPLVTGNPNVRFYAGAPLVTDDGDALGALCVIDTVPRRLRPEQKESLRALAGLAVKLLQIRRKAILLASANQEIQAREENYRIVSESASDAIITINENSTIVFANKAVEKIFGYEIGELIGNQISLIVPEQMQAAHSVGMRRYMQTGQRNIPWSGVSLPALRRDGREIQIEMSFGEYHQDGKRLFTAVIRDVTERQIMETRLRESEERYRFLAEAVPQQVWTALPDGRVDYGNYRTVEYFGKEAGRELLGTDWLKILHPEDLPHTIERWARAVETGEPYETEFRLRRTDGEYRWHLAQAAAMRDDENRITKWIGTNTDIHERKLSDEALRKSEEYRNLFQHANDAILIFEVESEIVVEVNEEACRLYGIERDVFIGKSIKQMSRDVERGETHLRQLLEKGNYQSFETVQYHSDGTPIHLLVNSSVIEYHGRRVILSINHDITERKTAERALVSKELQLAEAQRIAHLGSWIFDLKGKHVIWSDELFRIMGYEPLEITPTYELYLSLVHPDDRDFVIETHKKLMRERNGFSYEHRLLLADGTIHYIAVNATATVNEAGKIIRIAGTVQNISGRKLAEEKLRESEQWLRAIFDASRDGLLVEDDGKIIYINTSYAQMLGYESPDELRGAGVSELLPPEEAERLAAYAQARLRGETPPAIYEFRAKRKDASLVEVEASVSSSVVAGRTYITTAIRDITERKQAEKALLESEERLLQSQKMEAIGTLTGGVAHDFNNLLTAILGNAQLALRRISANDPTRRHLSEIESAGNRAAVLTRQLLAFSRRQHLDRRNINLNQTIADIMKLLNRIIGEDVEVAVHYQLNLASVFADPAQIEQVIMNLSVNARDAMPDGGQLAIETSTVELDENYCRQYPYVQPGKYVEIKVSDTGTGIDKETQTRVFEPFFTTKEVGKGTGLGLSMVYGIVKQHDGHINLYSEPGYGTTFKVYLPVVDSEIDEEKQTIQSSYPGGTETILVAEDEEPLRNLAKDILESLGYTVLLAKNGEEAVSMFAANRAQINMLLFDVVMPRLNGSEAYRQIRQLKGADLPLILMTGYSSETVQNRFVKQNDLIENLEPVVIQKPYSVEILGRVVRETLDKNRKGGA